VLMQIESVLQQRAAAAHGMPVKVRILSAACSSGEEVYSLSAIARSVMGLFPNLTVELVGWDIDPVSLKKARKAVYQRAALNEIPQRFRNMLQFDYQGDSQTWAVPDLIKRPCSFRVINLVSPPPIDEAFDVVLCRNMLIYFDQQKIEAILKYIRSIMKEDARLLVGVSEVSAISKAHFLTCGNSLFQVKRTAATPQAVHADSGSIRKQQFDNEILVVDDEPTLGEIYSAILAEDRYKVTVCTSSAGLADRIKSGRFGLVISDLMMPDVNGMELLKTVRSEGYKGAFVLVSGNVDAVLAKRALALGCNDVLLKPVESRELLRVAKTYVQPPAADFGTPDLVLLGASTGGTEVLISMLANSPKDSPPVLVVQHITPNMAAAYAERLALASGLRLGEMKQDEVLRRGHLYIALNDYHIGVKRTGKGFRLQISHEPPISGHRPSVDFLFESAAGTGAKCAAAIMTGMGRDGADGMLSLKKSGSKTFAQSEVTCMVFGMPKEAIKLGAVDVVASPAEIASQIRKLAS